MAEVFVKYSGKNASKTYACCYAVLPENGAAKERETLTRKFFTGRKYHGNFDPDPHRRRQ